MRFGLVADIRGCSRGPSISWPLAGARRWRLVLVALGWRWGLLDGDTPEWTWVGAVLLVDVAHVYATAFRVYLDPAEFARRRWVYLLAPVLGYVVGVALYSEGAELFWRALAYLAVFHFVRQQYGWVAMYRARAGERERRRAMDRCGGDLPGDGLSLGLLAQPFAAVVLVVFAERFRGVAGAGGGGCRAVVLGGVAMYAARSVYRGWLLGQWNPGKDLVVATTAICWYVGIVALNSDYAFTVTNVIIHGMPYIVLVYWFRNRRGDIAAQIDRRGAMAAVRAVSGDVVAVGLCRGAVLGPRRVARTWLAVRRGVEFGRLQAAARSAVGGPAIDALHFGRFYLETAKQSGCRDDVAQTDQKELTA